MTDSLSIHEYHAHLDRLGRGWKPIVGKPAREVIIRRQWPFESCDLLRNGRPFGTFKASWFSQDGKIELVDNRHIRFTRGGLFRQSYVLQDTSSVRVALAAQQGTMSRRWRLETSVGELELRPEVIFSSHYRVSNENGAVLARVEPLGLLRSGRRVRRLRGGMTDLDLLLIGLVCHASRLRFSLG